MNGHFIADKKVLLKITIIPDTVFVLFAQIYPSIARMCQIVCCCILLVFTTGCYGLNNDGIASDDKFAAICGVLGGLAMLGAFSKKDGVQTGLFIIGAVLIMA